MPSLSERDTDALLAVAKAASVYISIWTKHNRNELHSALDALPEELKKKIGW